MSLVSQVRGRSASNIVGWSMVFVFLAICFILMGILNGGNVEYEIIIYAASASLGLALLLSVIRRPMHLIYILIVWIFTQDIAVMFLSHVASRPHFQRLAYAVFLGKEVLLVITVSYLLLKRAMVSRKWTWPDLLILALGSWVIIFLLLPNSMIGGLGASPVSKLTSARTYMVLILLYLLGRWVPLRGSELERGIRVFFAAAAISLIFGLILTLLPAGAWENMGLRSFYEVKLGEGTARSIMTFGLPLNFYFPDLPATIVPWPGLRRLSSTIVEPITTGLVYAFLFLLSAALSKRHRLTPHMFIFGLATLLALGRGGFLVAASGYLLIRIKKPWTALIISFIAAVGIMLLYRDVLSVPQWGKGTGMRFDGTVSGLLYTINNPLGRGLGTSNYLTFARAGGRSVIEAADFPGFSTEMFISTLGTQTGILGIGLYIAFSIALIRRLFSEWQRNRKIDYVLARTSLAMSGAMTGLFVLGFASASGYGFVGAGMMYLFSGLVMNQASWNKSGMRTI